MKIVISFNSNYWPLADALLLSISNNCSLASEITVLTDCDETIRQYLEHLENKYGKLNRITLRIVDISEKLLPFNSFGRFPKLAFARLFIDHYCSGRVLYLDVDTLILSDLKSLYHWNIEEYGIAAVEDYGIHVSLREKSIIKKSSYLNAGVILLDCSKTYVKKRLSEARNLACLNHYEYGDQDALNIVLKGNFHKLPLRFNNYAFFRKDVKVIHFAHIKPWQNSRFVISYKDYYCFDKSNLACDPNVSVKKTLFIILLQLYIKIFKKSMF